MNTRYYLVGMLLSVAAILFSASSASAQSYGFDEAIGLSFAVAEYQGLPLVIEAEHGGGILTVHQTDGRVTEIDEYVGQDYWAFVIYDADSEEVQVVIATIEPRRTLPVLWSIIDIVTEQHGWLLGTMMNSEYPDHFFFGALTTDTMVEMFSGNHLLVVSAADGGESVMDYLESNRAINVDSVYVNDVAWLVVDSSVPLSIPAFP